MDKAIRTPFLGSHSDNRKSKTCPEPCRRIQNLKWAGFLVVLVLLVGCVGMAEAQQPKKVPRIGVLCLTVCADPNQEAFWQALRELGYIEGQNIAIVYRWAEGRSGRLPDLAAELVRVRVDIILTRDTPATHAAKNATTTIPIVMAASGDPVRAGLVASLARPGGNITGLSSLAPELSGKRLELLKEVVPKAFRVAVLWHSVNPVMQFRFRETQVAAQALGLQVQSLELQGPGDIENVFQAATRQGLDALFTIANPFTARHQTQIMDFAAKSRLPAMYEQRDFVEAGGLMSYGPSVADLYRRAAIYVDKILKGTKPADLPVEQPMKFDLVINLKAAKQIGLTIPPNVLARADKVIR